MAGYIKHFIGQEYANGDYKLAPEATSGIKVGGFVTIDRTEKEFDVPSGNALGEVFMVCNEVDWLVASNQDDSLFALVAGDFVKAMRLVDGMEVISDVATTNALAAIVGVELGVGADGKLSTIADMSVANLSTFKTSFVIKEKVKLFGRDALVLAVQVK